MCFKKIIILSLLSIVSLWANAYELSKNHVTGTLTFYNNTNETIDVTVNQDPSNGVPIGADGLELSYTLISMICSANPIQCDTVFTSDGQLVGQAQLDANTGKLLSYSDAIPYRVILNSQEVPLRTVTFDKS